MNGKPIAILAAATCALTAAGSASAAFEVRQLTTEGNNIQPCLSRGAVTWVRWNTVTGDEIWAAHLGGAYPRPTRLTDNGGEKAHPSSHGLEKIVWQGRSSGGDDWEIWAYERYGGPPLFDAFTDNDVPDLYPVLSGAGDFAWLQGYPAYEEVHYWNEFIHSESVPSGGCCPTIYCGSERPAADRHNVVWRTYDWGGTSQFFVHHWDGILTDISDDVDANMAHEFSLYGNTMAYQYGASPTWIRYWDGEAAHDVATGFAPSLHDGTIAFEQWDGHDWEIRYWNGSTVVEVTDNDYNDTQPSLYGDTIAWVGRPASGDHIFFARQRLDVTADPSDRSIHDPEPGPAPGDRIGPARTGDRLPSVGIPRPTPFRGSVSLDFDLARREEVRLRVYTAAGRLVRTLVDESRAPGTHTTVWNGRGDGGEAVASGVYFFRLEAGDVRVTRKAVRMPR